jgi:hypothetical protein
VIVAFVALIIGVIAAGIIWRLHRVAQARLDLFEQHYPILPGAANRWADLRAIHARTGNGGGIA